MTSTRESIEERLFRNDRTPTPPEVAIALHVSPQHVKKLCRRLDGAVLVNFAAPGEQPRYRIGRETFRALWAHCTGAETST